MAIEHMATTTMNFYVPRFEISIDDDTLPAIIANSISQISVTEKGNEGATFSFTVNDEFDMESQTFTWLDHPLFSIGNTVTIKMGYENQLEPMVTGKIIELEPSFFSGDSPDLVVTGQDFSYDYMKKESPAKTFIEKSFSDMATEIAAEADLNPQVEETPPYTGTIQKRADETYFSFLSRLARLMGFQCAMKERTLYFNRPTDGEKEILTLELGKDLISFKPRLNTSQTVTEVEVRQYNPADPETPNIGTATAGDERIQEPGKRTASEYVENIGGGGVKKVLTIPQGEHLNVNTAAKAEMDAANDGFITGDVKCVGIPQIKPGTCIRLEKVGRRFSGKYYVTESTHTMDQSGYLTRFIVKRNAI